MIWIYCLISFILGAVWLLGAICLCRYLKNSTEEINNNNVHFYIVRDNSSRLRMYLGRPRQSESGYVSNDCGSYICEQSNMKRFGIQVDKYSELTYDDGPLEIYLNTD